MNVPQIVIDTNVLVSGLRSNRGPSFRLLQLVGTNSFGIHLSVPLVIEYKDVLTRPTSELAIDSTEAEKIIAFHCSVAKRHRIFFLWRPFLPDPKDDMVLEVAVKAQCDFIVTFNDRDFKGVEKFGLRIIKPTDFLKLIGDRL